MIAFERQLPVADFFSFIHCVDDAAPKEVHYNPCI